MIRDVLTTPPAIEQLAIESYIDIDSRVDGAEREGIEARWEFGRLLVQERVGKQLLKGRLDAIASATGKSRSELQHRMRFAELYPTRDKVSNALDTYGSWREIVQSFSGSSESVHFSSDDEEWYTPASVIQRTVDLFGVIDLDPCSNGRDNPNVPAAHHFAKANGDDGLALDWFGAVYMNPPYGRAIEDWVTKAVTEYESAKAKAVVCLVPARPDTEWFYTFRDYPRCFIRGRLKFSGHDNSAPFPSTVVYLGKDRDRFLRAFGDLGDIYARIGGAP